MNKIKVLIADSHYMFIRGIECILSEDPAIEVVGKAQNGREAYELAVQHRPDVILMDVNLPVINGLKALKMMMKSMPEAKVLMFSSFQVEEQLMEAMKFGAKGCLLKNLLPNELLTFIHLASRGEKVISGPMAEKVMDCISNKLASREEVERQMKQPDILTKREKEILTQVVKGQTNKEIASALFISENTVKNHLRNIMEKLQMNNRVQAATFALKEGWLQTLQQEESTCAKV